MTNGPVLLGAGDVAAIVATVEAGGVVMLPTDTVYGLCCDPRNAAAVDRIYEIKGRRGDVPLATLVSSAEAARPIVDGARSEFDLDSIDAADWPGQLTLVLPLAVECGFAHGVGIGGAEPTVGLRRPAPSLVADVLATCGVLAATSANTHGEPTLVTPSQILDQLGVRAAAIAAYVEGGRLESTPSSVVNIGADGWTVLRDGPLTRFELDELLGVGATGS